LSDLIASKKEDQTDYRLLAFLEFTLTQRRYTRAEKLIKKLIDQHEIEESLGREYFSFNHEPLSIQHAQLYRLANQILEKDVSWYHLETLCRREFWLIYRQNEIEECQEIYPAILASTHTKKMEGEILANIFYFGVGQENQEITSMFLCNASLAANLPVEGEKGLGPSLVQAAYSDDKKTVKFLISNAIFADRIPNHFLSRAYKEASIWETSSNQGDNTKSWIGNYLLSQRF
jgi:hypothetical protein